MPDKVGGWKKNVSLAGALATPYLVGKKVQGQQDLQRQKKLQTQEQVLEKNSAFDVGVASGIAKTAKKEDDRPDPGHLARNMAASRALRRGDSGADLILANPELIGERATRGLKGAVKWGLTGAAGGGLAGALITAASGGKIKPGEGAAIGALLGGFGGAVTGNARGAYTADRDFLKKKGITTRNLGFSVDLNNEAKRKFLHKDYRGGGYKG